ncbi:MAG: tetratricopeptide repeat protein [Chloroflexi bacterium]|nr:tetratricopeptide repeat protein [Chloroflexota bacterium]
MDNKLKEAIATVRAGDTEEAQRQLTELLDENPQQVQGWYLLSLLVDSPQKQAAYLSKTLALNPQHEKAKELLAVLQAESNLAATSTIEPELNLPLDVVEQAETDELPGWLTEEVDDLSTAVAQPEPVTETAVPNENLPDWLTDPSSLKTEQPKIVEEEPTVVGQTAKATTELDKTVSSLNQTLTQSPPKPAKVSRPAPQSTRSLNIILGLLIILALTVMVLLAYLLLS